MRHASWKATVSGLLFALPFAACGGTPPPGDGGPSLTCGAGTIEKDGQCVVAETPPQDAGPDLECGPGTVPSADGSQCVPDLNCPPGTAPTNDGTGCAPLCEDPFILEGDACTCPAGLVPTPGGNDCQIDPALCAEGTIFDETSRQCRPITAPPPADDDLNADEAPVFFDLPGIADKATELGGVVGPVDRETGPDLDVFEFNATAGDRMSVQLVSFGAQAAAFLLYGIDDDTGAFVRMAFPVENRRAQRQVVIPVTGRYAFIVSDRANLLALLEGEDNPNLFVGGDDHTYSLVIDTLPAVAPITITADGTARTGGHNNIDAFRVDPASTPSGAILNAALAAHAADPDFDTVQLLWYVDAEGNYVEIQPYETPAVETLLPQLAGGTIFHVDYLYRLGLNPAWDYSLAVTAPTLHDGPTPGAPTDGSTGGDAMSFFTVSLQADHVYRARMRVPSTSTLDAEIRLIDTELREVATDRSVTVGGVSYRELRFYADPDGAGTYYIQVIDEGEPAPTQEPNTNLRLTLEEAPVIEREVLSLPDAAEYVVSLDAPAAADSDSWAGPWALFTARDIGDLHISTNHDVDFRAFHPKTFATHSGTSVTAADETATARRYRGAPGFGVLVQATGGEATGQFDLNARLHPSPFRWETEPNDDADGAMVLPVNVGAVLAELEAPAPKGGACEDLSGAPQITESGRYTAEISDPENTFVRDDWGSCATSSSGGSSGTDGYWVIPQQEAGTQMRVETLSQGGNGSRDTYLGLVQAPNDCDPTAAACLAYDDDDGDGLRSLLEYTWTGSEGDLLLIVESLSSGLANGTLVFEVALTPGPLNGFTQAGDEDWWALEVTEAGMLEVNIDNGPIAGATDVELTLYNPDGETVRVGPTTSDSLRSYIDQTGTYYAVVRYDDEDGDYEISWSLDPNAQMPVTCSNPIEITEPGTFTGNTEGGSNTWTPSSDSCFGYSASNYSSPEHFYSYTLAPGATLRASVNTSFDGALAVIDSCGGECLVGSDSGNPEEVEYVNTSSEPRTVYLVIDGYGSSADGNYTLTVDLFGQSCNVGEQRCTGDGHIEICNDEGTGFDTIECPGGCEFDTFERTASCMAYCGEGTANPNLVQCSGNVLQTCAADGTRYEETECPIACSDVVDPETNAIVDAVCNYGQCPGPLGATVCGVETINGEERYVQTSCTEDGAFSTSVSCAAGCDGATCATFVPAVLTAVPMAGACPLPVVAPVDGDAGVEDGGVVDGGGEDAGSDAIDFGELVTTSGTIEVDLSAGVGNDFDEDTLACGSSSSSGVDFFLALGPKPAGTTVRVRLQATSFDATLGFQTSCDAATCTGFVDDYYTGEESTYTYDGSEEQVLLVVDSFSGSPTSTATVEIEFSDDAFPTEQPICDDAVAPVCDPQTSVLTSCEAGGTSETTTYCLYGCNAAGDGCETLRLGEDCETAEAFPAAALVPGTVSFPLDLTGFGHDETGTLCRTSSTGPEGVFHFTAPFDGHVVFETEGRDTVMYVREGVCAGTDLRCDDDGGPGTASRVEFDVTAGTEYFVVVEMYSSSTTTTDITITMDLSQD